jgi:hypothetical protein
LGAVKDAFYNRQQKGEIAPISAAVYFLTACDIRIYNDQATFFPMMVTADSSTPTMQDTTLPERTIASSRTTSHLEILPRDLFESILARYCDGYTLLQFWYAAAGARNQPSGWSSQDQTDNSDTDGDPPAVTLADEVQQLLVNVLQHRQRRQRETRKKKKILPQEQVSIGTDLDDTILLPPYHNDEDIARLGWTRRFSDGCFGIDYAERVPSNLVWCGTLSFRDPRVLRPLDASTSTTTLLEERVQVMLFSRAGVDVRPYARDWELGLRRDGRNRRSHDGAETTSANPMDGAVTGIVLQTYNFVPIGGGRLVGVTANDRIALMRISQRMARYNLVGTLETSYRTHASTEGNRNNFDFVPRIISFSQAHQRVEGFTRMLHALEERKQHWKAYPPFEDWDKHNHKENAFSEDLDINSDQCSLYCSWTVDENYTDSTGEYKARQEHSALLENYRRYRKLFRSSSSDVDDAIESGW